MEQNAKGIGAEFVVSPLLLTVQQVAQMLNLGRTMVYGLLGSGQLPSVKLGRRRLIPRDGVERYVNGLDTNNGENE